MSSTEGVNNVNYIWEQAEIRVLSSDSICLKAMTAGGEGLFLAKSQV